MMGKHTGLLTKLKDYCYCLGKNHCAAHRINLSTQDAFAKDEKGQEIT